MNISELLKQRRIELGVSQTRLATHLNFKHKSSISKLELGKRQWKFTDVIKACELLELNLTIENK